MKKFTRSRRPNKTSKPAKPYPDFPLTPHPTKRWCKKIRGRLYYFGRWDDPEAALREYLDQRDDLFAGRQPAAAALDNGLSVRDLCNEFLTSKKHRLDIGQLSAEMFGEYHSACARVVDTFGKDKPVADLKPSDFQRLMFRFPPGWGPIRRGKMIQLTRSVFRYASEQDLIDKPVKFGLEFRKPGKAVLRMHKAKVRMQNGARMFAASELRSLIDKAKPTFKAMLLLAANTGFGNSDCSRLPLSALDLDGGWVDFPRPKTGIARRVPLWPETVAAIRAALALRPNAKRPEDAGLAFLTCRGQQWCKVLFHQDKDGRVRIVHVDNIGQELGKLLKKLGIQRKGLGFYTLRHTFRTIADEARDQPAANAIMGHADESMANVYRERISDERLRAVCAHVRGWLFDTKQTPQVQ
jgi:integrase